MPRHPVAVAPRAKFGYTLDMVAPFTTYIGVDTATGRRPFTYVALDAARKLVAVGAGTAVDVLSFSLGQQRALLALSPPTRPNRATPESAEDGLAAVTSYLLQPELVQGLLPSAPRTPPPGCPLWLRPSFSLADQLSTHGYQAYPGGDGALQWLETQCDAAFYALIGRAPFEAGSLEGRIQRQLVLADLGLDVPDAMEFFEEITRYRLLHGMLPTERVLPQPEVNAWMAAHVASLATEHPEALQLLQFPQGGCLYLPHSPSP